MRQLPLRRFEPAALRQQALNYRALIGLMRYRAAKRGIETLALRYERAAADLELSRKSSAKDEGERPSTITGPARTGRCF